MLSFNHQWKLNIFQWKSFCGSRIMVHRGARVHPEGALKGGGRKILADIFTILTILKHNFIILTIWILKFVTAYDCQIFCKKFRKLIPLLVVDIFVLFFEKRYLKKVSNVSQKRTTANSNSGCVCPKLPEKEHDSVEHLLEMSDS